MNRKFLRLCLYNINETKENKEELKYKRAHKILNKKITM